jgi:hypothetical protein
MLPEKCPVCGELMEKGYMGSPSAPNRWGKENQAGFYGIQRTSLSVNMVWVTQLQKPIDVETAR